MSPKDSEPRAPDATAAPPDDGHQGSYTVPGDSLQEPTSGSPYGPPLHHDPTPANRRGGALGVFVLLTILILGLVALVLYA